MDEIWTEICHREHLPFPRILEVHKKLSPSLDTIICKNGGETLSGLILLEIFKKEIYLVSVPD